MNAHTPGPWIAFDSREAHIPPAEEGADLGWFVGAEVGDRSIVALGIRNEANARLIAAAPVLLEALKGICSEMRQGEQLPYIVSFLVPMAEAAIAKATGQEATA